MRTAIARTALIFLLAILTLPANADDTSWSRSFGAYGVGWQNTASTVYDVGYRNGSIYIAGLFDRVDVVPANNIARYYQGQWYALDEGVNGSVSDMEILSGAGRALSVSTRRDGFFNPGYS